MIGGAGRRLWARRAPQSAAGSAALIAVERRPIAFLCYRHVILLSNRRLSTCRRQIIISRGAAVAEVAPRSPSHFESAFVLQ